MSSGEQAPSAEAEDLFDLSPAALRAADPDELRRIAGRARQVLVSSVARRGGHLGPNLGVVELTLALHRVFDSPRDVLLWDTGHQSYIHKMATGRTKDFETLRGRGGLSGYPSRQESEHDWVENSHAGTSLSYAAGFATAFARQEGPRRRAVAVIGDGALTAGMAMEALNDIVDRNLDVVVVLNDNARSYASTTGAVAKFLARRRAEGHADTEVLGCRYLGPVQGHDVQTLEHALTTARDLRGPVVVHVVTTKGLGYPPAEQDPVDRLHGVGPFDPASGRPRPAGVDRVSAGQVLSDTLRTMARADPRIVVVSAAMTSASGLDPFEAEFPDRIVDVGIAEQHAVTFAAGLAMAGLRPVVAVHCTFLGRAFDQMMFDVGLHGLPVVFVADRAGVTGGDGPSHHGLLDTALFRHVPGAAIGTPADAQEFGALLRAALDLPTPVLIRYNRALPVAAPLGAPLGDVSAGTWQWQGNGQDVLLIAGGEMLPVAVRAARRLAGDGTSVTLANARWVQPLDGRLARVASRHRLVVTVEDHYVDGGLGSAVLEHLTSQGIPVPVRRCGVPVGYLPHGDVAGLHRTAGLDEESLHREVAAALDGQGVGSPVGR